MIKIRSNMTHTLDAIKRKDIKIGFIGGSITAFENYRSWTEALIRWFVDKYSDVKTSVYNAAIGATTSAFGVFRVEECIIDNNCDLVFVEYAVNDYALEHNVRMNTREGLIRKLLKCKKCDVVLVYTYSNEMYEDMLNDRIPLSISEFEDIAEHYSLNSIWMGKNAWIKIKKGLVRWEEWLPDNTHPEARGSLLYAETVIRFMDYVLENKIETECRYISPLNESNWENARIIPFSEIKWRAPWSLRQNGSNNTMVNPKQFLESSALGATLCVPFYGKGIVVCQMFGKCAANFRYRIDDGMWKNIDYNENFDSWMGDSNWYRFLILSENLECVNHVLEIESIHSLNAQSCGNRLEIYLFGELR